MQNWCLVTVLVAIINGWTNAFVIPEWDYLLFSQRWPITACMLWEENGSGHKCNMPNDASQWLVHGLWPTKRGTDGPNSCDSAIHFDPDQLQPIMDGLMNHWTNIEAGTALTSFWKHEWNKHGTCASILPQLNSVLNYFSKGLQLNKEYDITSMLTSGNILPNDTGYSLDDIYNAIKAAIQKNPIIECAVDEKTRVPLISEIHICFDKQFNVIDCPGDVSSSCSHSKKIMYYGKEPNAIPEDFTDYDLVYGEDDELIRENERLHERGRNLLHFYRFIKFLMWFTL